MKTGVAALLVFALAVPVAHGHEFTDRYIPIGQSPGVSGTPQSMIGSIQAVSAQARSLTMSVDGGQRTVTVTDRTRIWIDRSRSAQTNLRGGIADLQSGRRAEVKYDDKNKALAEWIKVEAP